MFFINHKKVKGEPAQVLSSTEDSQTDSLQGNKNHFLWEQTWKLEKG